MSLLNAIVRASQKVQKAKPKKTTTVYHGSDADLTQDTIATQNKSGSDFGEGIYWASDIDEATNYGKNLYKADVSFENPLILENRYQINGIFDELIGLKEQGKVSKDVYMKEYLQSLGYDGLIVKNPIMGENTSKPWFVSLDNTSFNNFEKLNQGLLSQVQKAKPKSDLGEGLLGQVKDIKSLYLSDAKNFKTAEDFIKAHTPVYHGTTENIKKFDNDIGTFFTDDFFNADGYASGENVYEGYLDLKNPLVIDAKGRLYNDLETEYGSSTGEIIERVDATKHDGVVFKNIKDNWIDDADYQDPTTIYYTFNPQNSFLNESQLIDIWNKAHNKVK